MKKNLLLAGLLMLAATVANATLYTYSFTGINAAIPDANPGGYVNVQTVNLGTLPADGTTTEITDINVSLNISGGYNGDLYGYLVHSSGFAVLINRIGRDGSNPFAFPVLKLLNNAVWLSPVTTDVGFVVRPSTL